MEVLSTLNPWRLRYASKRSSNLSSVRTPRRPQADFQKEGQEMAAGHLPKSMSIKPPEWERKHTDEDRWISFQTPVCGVCLQVQTLEVRKSSKKTWIRSRQQVATSLAVSEQSQPPLYGRLGQERVKRDEKGVEEIKKQTAHLFCLCGRLSRCKWLLRTLNYVMK